MSLLIQYYQSEAVNIKLADNNIVMTWLQALPEPAQRWNYLKALVIARNSNCSRWLIDARALDGYFNENIIWTVREFFPSLMPFNETGSAIAYVLNDDQYEHTLESNDNSPVMAQGSFLQIELFREMEPAEKWLNEANRFVSLKQA
jgi:hypothetical protein